MISKRKQRVAMLAQLALKDRNPVKYIQAQFIISEIEKREAQNKVQHSHYIASLR